MVYSNGANNDRVRFAHISESGRGIDNLNRLRIRPNCSLDFKGINSAVLTVRYVSYTAAFMSKTTLSSGDRMRTNIQRSTSSRVVHQSD